MKVLCTFFFISLAISAFGQDSTWQQYGVKIDASTPPRVKAHMKHAYGPLSISTNLTSLISYRPFNNKVTIEPEYQFSDRFSLKIPIGIGLKRSYTVGTLEEFSGYSSYYRYNNNNFDPNVVPNIVEMPYRKYVEDIIVQGGVNPKYYFNGKSLNILSVYGSLGLNVGIADQYKLHLYDRLDSTSYYNSWQQTQVYEWRIREEQAIYQNHQFVFFNYEILFGVDINFSRRITCTYEMGYVSKLMGKPTWEDRIYTAIHDQDYVLNYEGPINDTGRRKSTFRSRLLLTFRF